MQFIDYLNKLKIKLLAPSIVCYRQLGGYRSELKYWAFRPAYLVLKDQPIGNDGYYKTVKELNQVSLFLEMLLLKYDKSPKT